MFRRKKKSKTPAKEAKPKAKKPKKQRLTRTEKKKLKARKKRAAKRQAAFNGQAGFVADEGYVEYDGYMRVGENGEYIALFDVLFKAGTHNPAEFGWMNKVIPTTPLRKGKVYFVKREKNMPKSTQDQIMSSTIRSRLATNANAKVSSDVRESSKKKVEQMDLQLAADLAKQDDITDSDLTLVIKASTPQRLEETLQELKQNYKDNGIVGITLVRKTAVQMDEFKNLPHKISANAYHPAQMQTVVAGDLFLPSSGYADPHGSIVGIDIHSYLAGTPSIIDFTGIRHAVIMTGGIRGILSVGGTEGGAPASNFGSAWAHVIADDNYLVNGTRTHHINLVPFIGGYHAYDSKVFDMTKYTINSLETYGTKEHVQQDANNNFDKIVEIIMLLMENDNPNPAIRSKLYNQLLSWVTERANGNGLYTKDPEREPTLAYRILATRAHDTYPTLQDFIPDLQSMVAAEAKVGERARQNAQMILDSVQTASVRFPEVFNKKTNIPDSFSAKDRNIYYDLSGLGGSEMIKGAMFLNVLAYVANRAKPNDLVVVHGIDAIKVSPRILGRYRDKLDRRGVGLVTTFEKRDNEDMNVETLNEFVHPLAEQDMVIIGGLQDKSLARIESSWGRALPENVKNDLTAQSESLFFVYRARDYGSAVIDTHLNL